MVVLSVYVFRRLARPFLEKHGATIQELTLSWCDTENASRYSLRYCCKILNAMPNLKKIVMQPLHWGDAMRQVSDDELPPFRKLKTLELGENVPSISVNCTH